MSSSHDSIVIGQFGVRANDYVASAVHASGADLDHLEELARAASPRLALDLGAGGGHVAYRIAAHADQVVASDLSHEMLAAVAATARERGIANIETRQASAELLPFADAHFDFLGCRFSAHHWQDFDAGLREARRVLARGCMAVFVDAVSPGPALLDTHLQAVELLRDPSHVRDYTASEWIAALDRAGFGVRATRAWQLRMDFPTWTARMATPRENAAVIRTLQQRAAEAITQHFAIEADGSFLLDTLLVEAVAA